MTPVNDYRNTVVPVVLFIVSLAAVLVVNGAVPFVAVPTLGQAIWSTGFAQSIANDSLTSIYAENIGYPRPAAMAFGLVGALTSAAFISMGMSAPDAYSSMALLWLSISFLAAFKIGRLFGVSYVLSLLGAVAWGTMPVVWGHSGYSLLSIGIALISLYMWAALSLFSIGRLEGVQTRAGLGFVASMYLLISIVSIFMDGYSFMMFASGASILGFSLFVFGSGFRKPLAFRLLVHFGCLLTAYVLFTLYIGKSQFEPANIDFFRGWGVDVMFVLAPTAGVHWVFDMLGFSVPRSEKEYFGDASVWITSFWLPVIIAALVVGFITRKDVFKPGLIAIALFGFYMSLGPSIKYESTKPLAYSGGPTMEEKYALAPTGSALLSMHLPGFKNMRASYRWGALGVFGAWALVMLGMRRENPRRTVLIAVAAMSVIIIVNLPHIPNKWSSYEGNREMFLSIDEQLVEEMSEYLVEGQVVAFLPWRNDFLVNYLASKLNVYTYNIGGDKNLAEARRYWPRYMRDFPMAAIDPAFSERVALVLASGEADVVFLPYIDMLWAAHSWPAPLVLRDQALAVSHRIAQYEWLDVTHHDYYSIVRLSEGYRAQSAAKRFVEDYETSLLFENMRSPSLKTQVGQLREGVLYAASRRGFLLFGPYRFLNAGSYSLIVNGEMSSPTKAWIDVVSDKGKTRHAFYPLEKSGDKEEGVLLSSRFELNEAVSDLEVRVFVGEGDVGYIRSYEVTPLRLE